MYYYKYTLIKYFEWIGTFACIWLLYWFHECYLNFKTYHYLKTSVDCALLVSLTSMKLFDFFRERTILVIE
jgi:hypothetical protein